MARVALALRETTAADSLLREFDAQMPEGSLADTQDEDIREVRALLAAAREDPTRGIEELTRLRDDCESLCRVRVRFSLGEVHEKAGELEAAAQAYEDYLGIRELDRLQADGPRLQAVHLRLARIHEALGNADEAVRWYGAFLELWSEADPEVAYLRDEAYRRLQELAGGA